MSNIWSKNKYIELLVNCLLFLVAINFLHYGQLILPAICLILFINNKFKFKVNNIVTFIVLCLFSITFFLFSYKLGFYSVMGFCLPMAYYIGSNIQNKSETNIKKIVYIITFGMAIHIVLNFLYELSMYDIYRLFSKTFHADIWTGERINTTNTASNSLFLISIIFYILFYEKKLVFKLISTLLLATVLIYNNALGRRTPLLLLVISFLLTIILDVILNKRIKKKYLYISLGTLVGIIIILVILYFTGLLIQIRNITQVALLRKIFYMGFSTDRLEILYWGLKELPNHLWGGQEISTIIEVQFHDLFFDILDYAGIIPFILIIVYFVILLIKLKKLLKSNNVTNELKSFICIFVLCTGIELFMEPVLSGISLYLIALVLIYSSFETLIK